MIRKLVRMLGGLALCAALWPSAALFAQVTTGSISGILVDESRNPIAGASVIATHEASGTRYGALTRADGRYAIPGMRVGGPYRVSASHIGYEARDRENIFVNLGVSTTVDITMRQVAVEVAGVTATAERETIISPERTGAATTVSRDALANLPSISGRLETVARITPQYGGNMSFVGQDNRLNNITVDGSVFNNSFGLAGTPGERTNVAPISLAAIEQIRVSVAPYDVRQGNFVGANVNTVTRSGTNELRGSMYYSYRNQDFVGTKAGSNAFDPGTFKYHNVGGWLSGPIIRNRLFFFANYEHDPLIQPGTNFRANLGGEPLGGGVTRVLASTLDSISNFMSSKFDYQTGGYQGYDFETPATRFLGKLDFNLNDRNKFSLRYNHLDSNTDVLVSNSSSLGFGSRRTNTTGLNFVNSNYKILENIRSIVGEWNAMVGTHMANNLIAGYTHQDESRGDPGTLFPMVDILEQGSVYTTLGTEPFTPNNELRYHTAQFQDNFTIYSEKHDITFGVAAEKYHSENVFFPGSQSVYVYNSLADFYTDLNGYLANPNRTTSPVTLNRFQLRWMNIPGLSKPIQPLDVFYAGAYAQDQWRPMPNLTITAGVRVDAPWFGKTAYDNPVADTLKFRDENGQTVQYNTGKLPDAKALFSPRIGFNWDVRGDRNTQVRGGTGVFTGRPAYVWISNQIGNTGVLTGFQDLRGSTLAAAGGRPFNPDPNYYKPTDVTGAPATSFELAVTDPDFKFPQTWRTDIAVDQRLPYGLIATGEYIYNRDVNGIYYINANLPAAQSAFTGADTRPRWTNNRLNQIVSSQNIVLKNQDVGRSWNIAASLERPFSNGLYVKGGYSYGESKNTVDPGSIASGSWTNNPHPGDPNNPGLGFSSNSPGHRIFLAGSYRKQWLSFGATTLGVFAQSFTLGNASYTFSGDLNGDGGSSNDLIYIPRNASEMNFQTYTQNASGSTPARTFTAAEQATAWDAYINQDDYLSKHRGEYAERGAVFLPAVNNVDVSLTQDLFTNVYGKRNTLGLRVDILNVGNLLNKDWGVGQRMVTTTPLIVPSSSQGGPADAQGRAQYRMRNFARATGQTDATGKAITEFRLVDSTFEPTAGQNDVYRIQFSLRYTFD